MLNTIYQKRYGKILIGLMLLIIGSYALDGYNTVTSWHRTNDHYQAEKTKKEYIEHPEYYTYWDENAQKDVSYPSYEEYVDQALYVFQSMEDAAGAPSDQEKRKEYDENETYYHVSGSLFSRLVILLVALAGFLLFFVDEKTAFNRFLFSLPVSRKELFRKKITHIAFPLLGSVICGQLLYTFIFYFGIPQPYMNVELTRLLFSVANNFCLIVLALSLSIFIGSMVGNLIFGPLTWLIFIGYVSLVPQAVNYYINLGELAQGNDSHVMSNLGNLLFILEIGKTSGRWYMGLLALILSGLFLLWAYRNFQKLSLEHDGDYLLHSHSRFPIFLLMTLFVFSIQNTFFSGWDDYFFRILEKKEASIFPPIFQSLFVLLVVAGICFTLVYFSSIKTWLRLRKERKLALR
ncbi:ABC-2 transporter permease [Enterococcus massiliensis]|uniref:ABC transporter permease n=1 Tax=Enterococcus massiliensis TaxID=1640685 RepID=UPI00065E1E9B|nr:ABC transporter permease [Enterococcus massiliensis]